MKQWNVWRVNPVSGEVLPGMRTLNWHEDQGKADLWGRTLVGSYHRVKECRVEGEYVIMVFLAPDAWTVARKDAFALVRRPKCKPPVF